MLDVVIVDDESIARARLRRLLTADGGVRIVAECADAHSAVDAIAEHRPDVVFLDVQMSGADGFSVVRAIPEADLPLVVFVTAYDAHALRAFEVSALDYLLKPFDADRLAMTLRRVRGRATPNAERRALLAAIEQLGSTQRKLEQAAATSSNGGSVAPRYADRFPVRVDGKVRFIATADIDYVESAANYVQFHVGAEKFTMRERLSAVADALDPSIFARIHRRTIVNLSRVHEIEPWFSGDAIVVLKDGRKLRLSRSFRGVLHRGVGV